MEDNQQKFQQPVKSIVKAYFIYGILWILFSDTVVLYLFREHFSHHTIQTAKGIFFVIVTGIFLYFLLSSNLEEIEEKEEELYDLAYFDQLTGLPNKRYLHEKLEVEVSKSIEPGFSLFYIKINNLNVLTDIKGGFHGSEIIKNVSERLKEFAEKDHDFEFLLTNYNYDKFIIVVFEPLQKDELKKLGEEINSYIAKLWEDEIIDHYLDIKIGISRYPTSGTSIDSIISAARIAAHNITEEDDYKFKCYDQQMYINKLEYENLKRDLRDATAKDEFKIFYQPKVKLPEEKIVGFEALIRWQHSKLGLISPADFISIAEENALISDIGEWVLKKVLNDLSSWKEEYGEEFNVSINLSPIELYRENKAQKIEEIFNDFNIDKNSLEFEITENAFLNTRSSAAKIIKDLRRMGFSIALDDFGIGYSSLSYLSRLPIDNLKLDKSFIDKIEEEKTRKLTESVIRLAQKLDLIVTAEGVENKKQKNILSELNCDIIQGYYYYKPLPIYELQEVLRNHNNFYL